MAINKRKILQSAQKHLQKGALDKALKDYQTLLQADPRDVNVRLKIGDIHLKQGATAEAIAAYTKVATRFMQDGFDAKAVALYKQITKIDPKRIDVYEPLAELYQRLGLTSDAMNALQTAADAHYREGHRSEALDLLRKMAGLDPANTTNRLKVADLLRQEGRDQEAVEEFEDIARELERQGDVEARIRVLEKAIELAPARAETLVPLARAQLAAGQLPGAERAAQALVHHHPEEPDGHELLAEVLGAAGREEEAAESWRTLAEVLKSRGDEPRARDIMQRFGAGRAFSAEDTDEPVLEGDSELALDAPARDLSGSDEAFSDPGYLSDDGLRLGNPIDGLSEGEAPDPDGDSLSGSTLPPLPRLDEEGGDAPSGVSGEEDLDQLLAEASVYLRYGKHDRAVESLRVVLAREPGHRGALEKLGEALSATGQTAPALRAWTQAAESAREEGDGEAFEALRSRIAVLDAQAAEALAPPAEAAAPAGDVSDEPVLDDIDIEIDGDLDAEGDHEDSTGALQGAPAAESSSEEEGDFGFSFDDAKGAPDDAESDATPPLEGEGLDLEIDLGAAAEEPDSEDTGVEAAVADDAGLDLEIELPEVDGTGEPAFAEAPGASDETPAEAATPSSQGSATTPQQLVEDLEEADFYFQQGLFDEARSLYERVIAVAPNHPQAMLRLGEIEAAQGGAPAGATPGDLDLGDAAADALPDEGAELSLDGDLGTDLDFADEDTEDAPESSAPPRGIDETGPLVDTDGDEALDGDLGLEGPDLAGFDDEASAGDETPVRAEASEERGDSAPGRPEETAPSLGAAESGGPPASAGDFDLAAELTGAISGEDTDPGRALTGGTEEEGFEQVFAAFKEGVQKELGDGDHQAHYDLGIAYREMGLVDDAIAEFSKALGAEAHRLPSLHMMGLCALDLGRARDAVAHLEQALGLPAVPPEQQVPLRYDLGRAYGAAGDPERAREVLEAVRAADPEFGDVEAELAALEGSAPAATSAANEAFESFDDLIQEAPEAEATPEPAYESFDDLMGDGEEAEAAPADDTAPGPEAAEAPAAPEAEGAPDEGPAEEPSDEPPRRGGRRKKISFV